MLFRMVDPGCWFLKGRAFAHPLSGSAQASRALRISNDAQTHHLLPSKHKFPSPLNFFPFSSFCVPFFPFVVIYISQEREYANVNLFPFPYRSTFYFADNLCWPNARLRFEVGWPPHLSECGRRVGVK